MTEEKKRHITEWCKKYLVDFKHIDFNEKDQAVFIWNGADLCRYGYREMENFKGFEND